MASTAPLPPDNPAVTAHITLLQGIINRLATASASCKTWCIALVAALVSLAGTTRLPGIVAIALVPVVIFGFLDASYLAQERAYRDLYKRVIDKIHTGTYTAADTFAASAPMHTGARIKAFFSWSVAPMYLGLIALYVIACYLGWLKLLAPPAATP
jgi:hypothetical protein